MADGDAPCDSVADGEPVSEREAVDEYVDDAVEVMVGANEFDTVDERVVDGVASLSVSVIRMTRSHEDPTLIVVPHL